MDKDDIFVISLLSVIVTLFLLGIICYLKWETKKRKGTADNPGGQRSIVGTAGVNPDVPITTLDVGGMPAGCACETGGCGCGSAGDGGGGGCGGGCACGGL
ncbi:hypothetical protein PTKIN_Ptkin09bG0175200 [Pterospermum kingtungense]